MCKKRFIDVNLRSVKLSILVSASLFLIGCGNDGFNTVHQVIDTVEVGDNIEAIDCIDFDKSLINDVTLSNDGGFSVKKSGKYTIIYTATNTKGKSKDLKFDVTVEDTVAPTVTIKEKNIKIPVGFDFSLNEYVSIEDGSLNPKLISEGEVNTDKEGKYTITVSAKDDSGNQSEAVELMVMVEKRETDLRNVKFGDSHEIVQKFETEAELVSEYTEGKVNNTLAYVTSVAGVEVTLIYSFNKNDELFGVSFIVMDEHSDYNEYYRDFVKVDESLTVKYGKPDVQDVHKGSLYDYCYDVGEAIMTGQVVFNTEWDLDNMNIYHFLQNDNEVKHVFNYVSKEYHETKDNSGF